MRQIYCDNSSTSFPKAPGLGRVMGEHIDNNGYNISRGAYGGAYSVERRVMEARELLCDCFDAEEPRNVIFTAGATMGLNTVLRGVLKPGDHVITTAMEHNAVVRPLAQLAKEGVIWEEAPCDETGVLNIEQFKKMIRPETKMVMATHGSNVCGTLIPIEEIGVICKAHDILFAVDASQTAGSVPVSMRTCRADALVFPAHKGLMGPQGIGAMILSKRFSEICEPVVCGGTGSLSHEETMPDFMPDKFQPGTLNIPGIIGMSHALKFVRQEGIISIGEKKLELAGMFIEEAMNMKGVALAGIPSVEGRCAVVSLDFAGIDNAEAGYYLEKRFGIMTRCGLHCAPHAHKTLGTFPEGTVRFSFGFFNTKEEVRITADAVREILK